MTPWLSGFLHWTGLPIGTVRKVSDPLERVALPMERWQAGFSPAMGVGHPIDRTVGLDAEPDAVFLLPDTAGIEVGAGDAHGALWPRLDWGRFGRGLLGFGLRMEYPVVGGFFTGHAIIKSRSRHCRWREQRLRPGDGATIANPPPSREPMPGAVI